MELTSRQRKTLRGMANTLDTALTVSSGVDEGIVRQVGDALEARELVKCSVSDSSTLTARQAADLLAEATGAQVVQVIGRRFVLYRRSSREGLAHVRLD